MSAARYFPVCLFCFQPADQCGNHVDAECNADAVLADLRDMVKALRERHRTPRAAFIGSAADLARLADLEQLLERVAGMDEDDSVWGHLCSRCEGCNGCEWHDGATGGELCERCELEAEARAARREVKP